MDPESTSTPNKIGPKKRKGIHDEVISPLLNTTFRVAEAAKAQNDEVDLYPENISADESMESDDSEDEDSSDNIKGNLIQYKGNVIQYRGNVMHSRENVMHSKEYVMQSKRNLMQTKENITQSKEQVTQFNLQTGVIICVIGIIISVCLYFITGNENNITISPTISDLKTQFPLQSKEFWLHLQSGISDIHLLNKPSVYIFLYETDNEMTLEKLLKNVSVYANCKLNNNCEVEPIVLKGEQLNTPRLISDYGLLIEEYGPQLQKEHIMIIRNLDKIHSSVAQALHSFCDEYTPLVSNSLFLFTMRVDKFEDEPLHQVLKVLRNKWKDLESDKLEPLLTRISNMVLRITSETTV